jgi:hypothetical protein
MGEIERVDEKTQAARLEAELRRARRELQEEEAELAAAQAAVNRFRMHCRLQLDALVSQLLALGRERQSVLIRLALLQQAAHLVPYQGEGEEAFWRPGAAAEEADEGREETADFDLPPPPADDEMSLKRLYRELARKFHPDLAETAVEGAYRTAIMAAVNAAYAAGDLRALYDLAGELEPEEVAELAGIESKRIRRLRQQIMTCRRRRRKVKQQYRALRRETTARLWQKAQEVAAADADWWSSVQRELEAAIARRRREIAELEQQAAALEEAGATVAWE